MASQLIRPTAVAGLFYPDDPRILSTQLMEFIGQADQATAPAPRALIVPHAGYVYSGPVAASAYALLEPVKHLIRRVVVLGPSHRVPLQGAALPAVTGFASPLGTVEVDAEAVLTLSRLPQVVIDDQPHAKEHALEVQLPFLQTVLDHFRIVPITVGFCEPQVVADMIDAMWSADTLIVVSSDLSHYNNYSSARDIDRRTINHVLALEEVDHEQACGATAINGMVLAARRHNLVPHLLDLRNSGDTAGDRSRVVGYASISFTEADQRAH